MAAPNVAAVARQRRVFFFIERLYLIVDCALIILFLLVLAAFTWRQLVGPIPISQCLSGPKSFQSDLPLLESSS